MSDIAFRGVNAHSGLVAILVIVYSCRRCHIKGKSLTAHIHTTCRGKPNLLLTSCKTQHRSSILLLPSFTVGLRKTPMLIVLVYLSCDWGEGCLLIPRLCSTPSGIKSFKVVHSYSNLQRCCDRPRVCSGTKRKNHTCMLVQGQS